MNFINYNNMEVIEDGKIKVDICDKTLNPFNIVHGGLIFSMGDTVMGLMIKNTGRNAVTISSSINFISPGVGKYLVAQASVVKNGMHTCVMEAKIVNDKCILVATMSGTYYYIS